MAMTMKMDPNMGKTDRWLRGILGGLMLVNGLRHRGSMMRRLESVIGGAFFIYGLTGFDPLLKYFGASTIPGAENNALNMMKQALPGQGINPMLTEQASPRKKTKGVDSSRTVSKSFAVG